MTIAGEAGRGGDDDLDRLLPVLAARARTRNLERVDLVLELMAPGPPSVFDDDVRTAASALCHAVAGSAGTFGDDVLSEAARRLETALESGDGADLVVLLEEIRGATGRSTPPS